MFSVYKANSRGIALKFQACLALKRCASGAAVSSTSVVAFPCTSVSSFSDLIDALDVLKNDKTIKRFNPLSIQQSLQGMTSFLKENESELPSLELNIFDPVVTFMKHALKDQSREDLIMDVLTTLHGSLPTVTKSNPIKSRDILEVLRDVITMGKYHNLVFPIIAEVCQSKMLSGNYDVYASFISKAVRDLPELDSETISSGLRALKVVLGSGAYYCGKVGKDFLPVLTRLLYKHSDCSAVAQQTIACMCLLTANSYTNFTPEEYNDVKNCAISLIDRFLDDEQAMAEVFGALNHLCCEIRLNQMNIDMLCVMPRMLRILERHPPITAVLDDKFVRGVWNDDKADYDAIMKIFAVHLTDETIARNCCMLISVLCGEWHSHTNSFQRRSAKVLSSSANGMVFTLCEICALHPSLQTNVASTLQNLRMSCDDEIVLLAGLTAFIDQHMESKQYLSAACEQIRVLCNGRTDVHLTTKVIMGQQGFVERLVQIHERHPSLTDNVQRAVQQLCSGRPNNLLKLQAALPQKKWKAFGIIPRLPVDTVKVAAVE